jgi:putative DNA primase/helicase
VGAYWAETPADGDSIDINTAPLPPLLAVPVEVGLGKSTVARQGIAAVIASGRLGGRKVIYAVPRHDLGQEQADAFRDLGINSMMWKGRHAPDPTPADPERQMCLDPGAPFDALEVEQAVEQAVCRVKRRGDLHLCARYGECGYQAQKPVAATADVILCAHDSLFHEKPAAIGTVGLLVMDESFWQSGLRGTDGRTILTLDGLRPVPGSLSCYDQMGRIDWDTTADLAEARGKLWRVLGHHGNGAISVAALRGAGLTPKECALAAGWERRRLRDPGLLPGMDAARRAERIRKVLPPEGEPWAPPGRAAVLWMLLADALDGDHDAAGVVVFDDVTPNGTVRSLRLHWRAGLRDGWAAGIPVLHLDATLRPDLVRPFLPTIRFADPLTAVQPHVTVRQILGAPTTASALSPAKGARERDHQTAAHNLRDIAAFIALRAGALRGRGDGEADLLVVGQKDAVTSLSAAGLPTRVATAHFNGLSGLDRWGGVAGLIVLGRTLPARMTVESLASAMTNRPVAAGDSRTWWYGSVARAIHLDGGGTRTLDGEAHADPLAEAIRWSICEAELIQAIGRARGVNRTAETPLEIDLLTDIVLPVTVQFVAPWDEVRPDRTDIMAAAGVILDNAADMARCFPDLWPTAHAAKQDRWRTRTVTNGYYRKVYNSQMLRSSGTVTYQPAGAGQKPREAVFDVAVIRNPRAWLEDRLGPLVRFEVAPGTGTT